MSKAVSGRAVEEQGMDGFVNKTMQGPILNQENQFFRGIAC
jgi:hypothetical protein